MYLTSITPSRFVCTTRFEIQIFHILSSQCIYVFCAYLVTTTDFPLLSVWLAFITATESVSCAVRTGSTEQGRTRTFAGVSVSVKKTRIHPHTQIRTISSNEAHLVVFQTDQTAPLGPVGKATWDLGGLGSYLSPQARYPVCSVVSTTSLTAHRWQNTSH